jgi:cell division protein FtsN
MMINKFALCVACVLILALGGCSRQQSDWQKTRQANTVEAYDQFLKKYPTGEFTPQAQARVKELNMERDWERARDADTPDAYQAFLKQYPEGKLADEARIRIENFNLAQTPAGSGAAPGTSDTAAVTQAPAAGPTSSPGAASAPKPVVRVAPPAPVVETAPTTESKPPRPLRAQSKSAGTYGVQLGAFKSGSAAAHQRWAHLQREYPKLLAGLSSKVVPKKTAGGTLYRLEAMGVSEKHARLICKSLKAKSQACVVVAPAAA